ncbi:unnamed protein product [Urochloa humidicola]
MLYRFVGDTESLFANKTLEIADDVLASYKNQGWYTCCPLITGMFVLLSTLTHGLLPFVKHYVTSCEYGGIGSLVHFPILS